MVHSPYQRLTEPIRKGGEDAETELNFPPLESHAPFRKLNPKFQKRHL